MKPPFAPEITHEPPVFYRNPYALRFELGDPALTWRSPLYLPQALARVQAVFAAVFAECESMDILAVRFSFGRQKTGRNSLLFRSIARWHHAAAQTWRVRPQGGYDRRCFHDAYTLFQNLPPADADTGRLLMAAVQGDFPDRRPHTAARLYFYEPQQRILLHVYDDRGMDVAAASAEALLPFYRRFHHWLLDYDRARMDEMFAGLA